MNSNTNKDEKIPKILHFCWFGGNPYTPLMEKCMKSWETQLPDWEIKKWDESNIPPNIPYLKYALDQKLYAFAADFMRFYALYEFGGVYLDTDVEIVQNFESLRQYDAFAASENSEELHINGAVLGGKPQALFFKALIDYYIQADVITFQTIPKVITKIYLAQPELLTILPYTSFYPYNPYDPNQLVKQLMYCDIQENTYAIHHWHKTWKMTHWQKFLNSIRKRISK
ncbi:polysaccharide biosynthesis protein [Acinetobacter lwoffii]|jgi:mannosyltransferase OCH1-like enzyme|uniref:glycosyltransferase family 32 protein n=1 Tax=Acinetobacter TaxID=469 RepID=UPI0015D162BD|nr:MULTISPECIES: glycosyltransferase [Acinetobacter]MCO8114359.1 polysaccharide biosynthesis protein [Acinetobacter lwoffii]